MKTSPHEFTYIKGGFLYELFKFLKFILLYRSDIRKQINQQIQTDTCQKEISNLASEGLIGLSNLQRKKEIHTDKIQLQNTHSLLTKAKKKLQIFLYKMESFPKTKEEKLHFSERIEIYNQKTNLVFTMINNIKKEDSRELENVHINQIQKLNKSLESLINCLNTAINTSSATRREINIQTCYCLLKWELDFEPLDEISKLFL